MAFQAQRLLSDPLLPSTAMVSNDPWKFIGFLKGMNRKEFTFIDFVGISIGILLANKILAILCRFMKHHSLQ